RRHTRSTRDWSSDVCSSDLPLDVLGGPGRAVGVGGRARHRVTGHSHPVEAQAEGGGKGKKGGGGLVKEVGETAERTRRMAMRQRSDERRVGKEGGGAWGGSG